jgi:uncharacterized cupin superfamily protein
MATIINPEEFEFGNNSWAPAQFDLMTIMPRLSKATDAKQLIFDIRKLNPGKYSFPYHFHQNSEELMYIISGEMTVRASDKLEVIQPGQMVFFELGETSAHQFYNHTNSPCVYLDIRSNMGFDVTEYPDSGKVNVSPFNMIFEKGTQVGYFKGEENVEQTWKRLKKDHSQEE